MNTKKWRKLIKYKRIYFTNSKQQYSIIFPIFLFKTIHNSKTGSTDFSRTRILGFRIITRNIHPFTNVTPVADHTKLLIKVIGTVGWNIQVPRIEHIVAVPIVEFLNSCFRPFKNTTLVVEQVPHPEHVILASC